MRFGGEGDSSLRNWVFQDVLAEVPAFAGMTCVLGVKEIPAFAGIEMLNIILLPIVC